MTDIDRRTACPFSTPNGVPVNDQSTFDRLHNVAGVMSYTAQYTEGVGGTETANPNNPEELLRWAIRAVELATDALDLAVDVARDHGMSWQKIGDLFGISKQAAWDRFGKASVPPPHRNARPCCGHPAHEPGRCEYFTAPKTAFPGSIEPCPCGK